MGHKHAERLIQLPFRRQVWNKTLNWTGRVNLSIKQPSQLLQMTPNILYVCWRRSMFLPLHTYCRQCHVVVLWRWYEVRAIGLMEKLIRGQASHLYLLTHFHPSHCPPRTHLPLSVIHSPTTADELILSHTLCLHWIAVPFSPYSGAIPFSPPERKKWPFVSTPSPIRCPSLSFLPLLSILLFLSSAGVWSRL